MEDDDAFVLARIMDEEDDEAAAAAEDAEDDVDADAPVDFPPKSAHCASKGS